MPEPSRRGRSRRAAATSVGGRGVRRASSFPEFFSGVDVFSPAHGASPSPGFRPARPFAAGAATGRRRRKRRFAAPGAMAQLALRRRRARGRRSAEIFPAEMDFLALSSFASWTGPGKPARSSATTSAGGAPWSRNRCRAERSCGRCCTLEARRTAFVGRARLALSAAVVRRGSAQGGRCRRIFRKRTAGRGEGQSRLRRFPLRTKAS